jgi:hypothetical protein
MATAGPPHSPEGGGFCVLPCRSSPLAGLTVVEGLHIRQGPLAARCRTISDRTGLVTIVLSSHLSCYALSSSKDCGRIPSLQRYGRRRL